MTLLCDYRKKEAQREASLSLGDGVIQLPGASEPWLFKIASFSRQRF